MNEIELLESTLSEYRYVSDSETLKTNGDLNPERLVSLLSKNHDWTHQGAIAITGLATEYGAFMLRNALALAIALGMEDGDRGF